MWDVWLESPLGLPTSYFAVSSLIQLPPSVHFWEAVGDGSNIWASSSHWETRLEFWAPGFGLTQP